MSFFKELDPYIAFLMFFLAPAVVSFDICVLHLIRTKQLPEGSLLPQVTVISVILAVILLGLAKVLTGPSVAAILGAIVGYVLSSMPRVRWGQAQGEERGGRNGKDSGAREK